MTDTYEFPGTAGEGQRFEPYTPSEPATIRPTAKTFFRTITGWDEIAIRQQFGTDFAALRVETFSFMRALIFVDLRRHGMSDEAAHAAALEMTLGAAEDYFAGEDSPAELGKDEPAS
jgi:hypothetical protein